MHRKLQTGWPDGTRPIAAVGLSVAPLATGLDHPRWVYVLPNGDVLVAESNAPPKPEDGKGIKSAVMGVMMKRAGAGVPSANRITLLRDADGDGMVELRTTFLQRLNSPIGMVLVGNNFQVANSDAIVRFPYVAGQSHFTSAPTKVFDLPGGPINHHWTKNIIASAEGSKLYATVGSNSNVAENSYYGPNVDVRVKPPAPELVAKAVKPDYSLCWHVAPLGLTSSDGATLPAPFNAGFSIGQHGSWNRKPRSGYNVVFVAYGGKAMPSAQPVVVLSGFVSTNGDAQGRPVGVAIDKRGGLLVADDVGNVIWRVTSAAGVVQPAPTARAANAASHQKRHARAKTLSETTSRSAKYSFIIGSNFPSHGTYAAHIELQPLSKTDFNVQFEAALMPVGVGDSEFTSVYFPIPVIGE